MSDEAEDDSLSDQTLTFESMVEMYPYHSVFVMDTKIKCILEHLHAVTT